MEAVNTDRRICMKFLSDIEIRVSFSVQRSNFYLLAILQPLVNILLLGMSHTEAKANTRHVFKVRSGEPLKITHKR